MAVTKRILVVDDEAALARMLKLNLEQTGLYEVRTETQGAKAIEAVRAFRPDLVLLDVMMPGMLGSEIAEQLQLDPELRATKFIFLTAVVTAEEVRRSADRIGGHTFVAKPIGADDLCRVVAEQLSR